MKTRVPYGQDDPGWRSSRPYALRREFIVLVFLGSSFHGSPPLIGVAYRDRRSGLCLR